jgi:four helix bundle protein
MQDFRNLEVWRKAHTLTLDIYRSTREFPSDELYGLTSQMRRSASSVPTNIAEGCGRSGNKELVRFLQISMGSASELEYQLLLSRVLDYLSPTDYESLHGQVVIVKKMAASLMRSLRERS